MSLIHEVDGLLAGFEGSAGLSEQDRAMVGRKRKELPGLLDRITEAWSALDGRQQLAEEDLRLLYAALRTDEGTDGDAGPGAGPGAEPAVGAATRGGTGALIPFEQLAQALRAPVDEDLVQRAELDAWGRGLDSLSPRVPGTEAMDRTAAYLVDALESMGVQAWTEPLDFRGVFFHSWSFELTSPTGRSYVCFPENNVAFGDVRAELVDIGSGREADYAERDVRGKIVLINWGRLWDHEGPCASRQRYGLLHLYDLAYAHGAAGMVGYFEDTPGNSLKLLEPGIRPIGGSNTFGAVEAGPEHQFRLPALNIGRQDALEIKALLADGEVGAHLVIEGTRKTSTTQSVLGFLPGTSNATIAVGAHSCTAFEGAICDTVGVVGALALARYFSALPLSRRKKSLLVFFDSFHVWGNCCQTANMVLKEHTTLANEIEAFLWLDHISDGQANTNRLLISSDNPVLWPLSALALAGRGVAPLALPLGRIWSLCATGAFERRGIPTLTMQALGDYVLTTEDTWDKFDLDVVRRDVLVNVGIASALQELELPADTPGEPVGGCGSLFTSTELATYPPGESYVAEASYPLYVGGEHGEVRILRTDAEKERFIAHGQAAGATDAAEAAGAAEAADGTGAAGEAGEAGAAGE
jgi:hypothetical protein